MEASLDGNVVAALIGGGITMFLGLLAVAWRMGRLEQTVKNLGEDVAELIKRDHNGRDGDRNRYR